MAKDRLAIALNTRNAAISQYQEWNFNSMARTGKVLLGANEDGLFTLLDSSTDNGTAIAAYALSKKMNFGELYRTWWLKAYLSYRATGNLTLTTTPDGASGTAYTVTNDDTTGGWHTNYVDLDRTLQGDMWSMKIANVTGCDMSLKSCWLFGPSRKPKMVFQGIRGLNTAEDPAGIAYDSKTGIQEMAELINMDVDDALIAHRRKGYTLRQSGSFHSLYCGTGPCLIVKDASGTGTLYSIDAAYGLTALATGLTAGARVSYLDIGPRTYWTNGHQRGYVSAGANASWTRVASAPPDYTTNERATLQFSDPPYGTMLEYFAGRIWTVQGQVAWYSEPMPYLEYYQLGRSYRMFPSDITMMRRVTGGMYFSDESTVWFMSGNSPMNFEVHPVSSSPAIRGTDVWAERTMPDGTLAQTAMWTSPLSIFEGLPGGVVIDRTDGKLDLTDDYPIATSGSAHCWNGRYVCCLEP